MSLSASNHLRTLAFGDVEGGFWGAALHAAHPVFVFGDASGATWTTALSAEGWSAEGVGWRLTGEGVDLHVAPGGEAEEMESEESEDSGADLSGCDELCRVRGTVGAGGGNLFLIRPFAAVRAAVARFARAGAARARAV